MTPKNDNYEHNLYYTQHKWLPHFFYGATAPLMKEIQEQVFFKRTQHTL